MKKKWKSWHKVWRQRTVYTMQFSKTDLDFVIWYGKWYSWQKKGEISIHGVEILSSYQMSPKDSTYGSITEFSYSVQRTVFAKKNVCCYFIHPTNQCSPCLLQNFTKIFIHNERDARLEYLFEKLQKLALSVRNYESVTMAMTKLMIWVEYVNSSIKFPFDILGPSKAQEVCIMCFKAVGGREESWGLMKSFKLYELNENYAKCIQ